MSLAIAMSIMDLNDKKVKLARTKKGMDMKELSGCFVNRTSSELMPGQ